MWIVVLLSLDMSGVGHNSLAQSCQCWNLLSKDIHEVNAPFTQTMSDVLRAQWTLLTHINLRTLFRTLTSVTLKSRSNQKPGYYVMYPY
jgi:hypothetical protein